MSAPLSRLNAHPLSGYERDEIAQGRTHWTVEDYLAAGREEFDRIAAFKTVSGERERYARAYVEVRCPAAKIAEHRRMQREALYAEFGAPERVA